METARAILTDFGAWIYVLLFGYCALKSGYLPLFAGYFAGTGDLDLSWTILSVFAGGAIGDELRFWIARRAGPKLLSRPRFARLLSAATRLFERHGAWYCFAYRYAKGLRTIGALPIGLAGWRWRRFALINVASAAIWASVLVFGGYIAGGAVVEFAESYGAGAAIAVAMTMSIALAILGRRLLKMPAEDSQ